MCIYVGFHDICEEVDEPSKNAYVWADYGGSNGCAGLATHADFGCVNYETDIKVRVVGISELYTMEELKLLKKHRVGEIMAEIKRISALAKLDAAPASRIIFMADCLKLVAEAERVKACTSMTRSEKSNAILASVRSNGKFNDEDIDRAVSDSVERLKDAGVIE